MTTKSTHNKPCLLVTGSEGSLSQWIIPYLIDTFDVVGIDNHSRYGEQDKSRNYKFIKADLLNFEHVDKIFCQHRPQYVIHCAAQIYGVAGLHKFGADILGNNVTSTHSLMSSCAKYNVRKVAYISSSMVYERANTSPFTEDLVKDIPCPYTGYGLSKLFGEKLVEQYHQQYGIDYVIWRLFNVVTPYEFSESQSGIAHVLADFIKKIKIDQCQSLEIFGDGNQIRCFTWIDDVAEMIAKSSWLDTTSQKAINLGSEIPTKIIDLGKMIWAQSGRHDPFRAHFVPGYKDDVIHRIPDCSLAKTIGWNHTMSMSSMIDRCLSHVGGTV